MKNLIYILLSFLFANISFAQDTIPPVDGQYIRVFPESIAEFPGGRKALLNFLAENIDYAKLRLDEKNCSGISFKSIVKFIVETDGSLSDITIARGAKDCPECDAEALRVVKLMPNWIPAERVGKVIRSSFVLPMEFSFQF